MPDKSEDYILGIEIAEHSLRVVQRHIPSNTIDLVHIEPLTLSEVLKGDNLALLLRQVIRLYRKLLKTRYAVVSLPATMTFIRIMFLDSDSGDLKDQIEWEIEQETVGKTGKHIFDWINLSQPSAPPPSRITKPDTETELKALEAGTGLDEALDRELAAEMKADAAAAAGPGAKEKSGIRPVSANGAVRYLVVAVEEERVRWMEEALKKLKVVPVVCDVDVLALINIFSRNYPEDLSEGAALIYLTGGEALLALTRDGSYIDSDRVGGIKLDSPETLRQSVTLIENKVRELTAAVAGGPQTGIKRCFLCGDPAADTRLRDQLMAAFTIPAEVLNPFRAVSVAEEIKSQVLMVSPALAVVTGLTLRAPGEG